MHVGISRRRMKNGARFSGILADARRSEPEEQERTFAEPSEYPVALSKSAGLRRQLVAWFSCKPKLVLNWRSSQPAEKTAEERKVGPQAAEAVPSQLGKCL
jgi:hypothetical protein